MRLVKCDVLTEGPGPSEKVVAISTSEGKEEIVLHSTALDAQGNLEVGFLGSEGNRALIELPRESASGRWRVWVPADTLVIR